ncbi:MAG: glycosyltransferase [Oligoflexia bacterium]|nr:glycosyltransferase [Oligoflexia bacterium]
MNGFYIIDPEIKLYNLKEKYYLQTTVPYNLFQISKRIYDFLNKGTDQSNQQIDKQILELLLKKNIIQKYFFSLTYNKSISEQISIPISIPTTIPTSIIIPVKNNELQIQNCLQKICELNFPKEQLEVIIVDDGSTDATYANILSFNNTQFKCIHFEKSMGASYARNFAAKIAKGELLAFIDSDCMAHADWLYQLTTTLMLSDKKIVAIGGSVDGFYNQTSLDKYEKISSPLNMQNWRYYGGYASDYFYLPTCNLIVKKDIFLKLGGLNEKLTVGEDVDFCWRLKQAGYNYSYLPAFGKVYHQHRNIFFAFIKRRFDYGTSEAILIKLHPQKKKNIHLLGFCYYLSFLPLLRCSFMKNWVLKKVSFKRYLYFHYNYTQFLCKYYFVCIPFFFLSYSLLDFYFKKKQKYRSYFIHAFYLLSETIAYQLGVYWGMIREKNFWPILFKVK